MAEQGISPSYAYTLGNEQVQAIEYESANEVNNVKVKYMPILGPKL